MNRVLVTGADGFIGKNLIPRLMDVNYSIIEKYLDNGDIADERTWSEFPTSDVVIHLAARTFVPDSWTDTYDFLRCNLLGTIAALDYCRKNSSKLILLSSYLYGTPTELPIKENAALIPTNPYALSKKLAEEACQFYSDNYGVKVVILRPFNIYGPKQSESFLIQSVISQIRASHTINVKDLEPRRDYVYIDDVASAILKAIEYDTDFDTFNIGSGKSYSVANVIDILQEIMTSSLPVVSSNERRQNEIMETVAAIEKAKKYLDWEPEINLVAGLNNIIQDY